MDHSQLQSRFEEQISRFEQLRGFIRKCHELSDRFRAAVVEKVVGDYEQESLEVVGAIMLIQPDVEAAVAALREQREGITKGVEASKLGLEELELRLAIGELEQDEFEAESTRFRGDVEAAEQQYLLIDSELEMYEDLLGRWNSAGQEAGVLKAA